ncbi:MAG: hypothetical protein R6V08_03490 [Desulfuromonadales bacterium]
MELLRQERLSNGLVLEFHDASNRYFGDYHRLHIEMECRMALDRSFTPLASLSGEIIDQARSMFGDFLQFRGELTRMGVSGADLEQTRGRMIEDFMSTSGRYISGDEFPARFVQRRLEQARKKKRFVPRIL